MTESEVLTSELAVSKLGEAPIRILHVDDDMGFLKTAMQVLKMQGAFEVEIASSVEDALEKMKEKTYDAIISDYIMPEKSGLEFLRELREAGNLVPFVLFTGKGREEVAIEALNLGADHYINKSGMPDTVYAELAHGVRQVVTLRRSERARLESEQLLRASIESADDIIVVQDLEGRYLYYNAASRYGLVTRDVVGKTPFDFFDSKTAATMVEQVKHVASSGQSQKVQRQLSWKGEEFWFSDLIYPIKDAAGHITAVGTISRNTTELKNVEEERGKALHGLNERVRELRCLYEISKLVEKPNISVEEILRGTNDLLPPAYQYSDIACARIVFENREVRTENFKETRWKQQSSIKVHGKEVGVVEVCYLEEIPTNAGVPFLEEEKDLMNAVAERLGRIIERKKLMDMTLAQSEFLTSVLGSLAHPFCVIDPNDYTIKMANPAAGVSALLEKSACYEVIHGTKEPCGGAEHPCPLEEVKKTKKPAIVEHVHLDKNGNARNVEVHAHPIFDNDGNMVQMIEYALDVTERKKARDEVAAGKERLEYVLDAMADSICVTDFNGNITTVNKAMVDLFGIPKKKLFTMKGRDLAAEEDKAKIFKAMQDTVKTGQPQDAEVTGRLGGAEGRQFWLIFSSLKDEKGEPAGFVTITRDITELKQKEEELRDSEERLSLLFELAPDAYYLNDLRGNFVDGNRAAEEMTGYRREELIGKNLLKLRLLPRSQVMKAAKLLTMNALGKATGPDEFVLNRKDGPPVPVEIRTYPARIKGKAVVLGIARDISERKRLEEKLRVVGGLTRHDVRNKLSTVTGNVYLLRRKLAGDPQALKQLNGIEAAVRLVEKIYEFARTYEKLGVEELTYINAGKAFDEAASLFSDYKGVKVVNECRGLTVLGDSLLRQLFYNLIDDSLKYGEKIHQIKVHYRTTSRDQLELVYEDDGVGIPDDVRRHLFKEGVGKGTGYGLFMIKRICEVYGWTIQETGKPGKGAQFTMTIPSKDSRGERLFKIRK